MKAFLDDFDPNWENSKFLSLKLSGGGLGENENAFSIAFEKGFGLHKMFMLFQAAPTISVPIVLEILSSLGSH